VQPNHRQIHSKVVLTLLEAFDSPKRVPKYVTRKYINKKLSPQTKVKYEHKRFSLANKFRYEV
jgi:hypothetical protein